MSLKWCFYLHSLSLPEVCSVSLTKAATKPAWEVISLFEDARLIKRCAFDLENDIYIEARDTGMFAAKDLVVSSTSLPTDSEDDYLQDQDLWKDSLPQPYQLIDELLQDVLFTSWQLIEARKSDREAEKSKPVIPNYGESRVLTSIKDVTDVTPCSCLHENCSVVFVTCSAGLLFINMKTCTNGEGEPVIIAQDSLNGTAAECVHSRCWRDMKYHSLLTVTMTTGKFLSIFSIYGGCVDVLSTAGKLRLYALYNSQFILLLVFSSNVSCWSIICCYLILQVGIRSKWQSCIITDI